MTDVLLDDAPWMQPASLGVQLCARQPGRTPPVVAASGFEPGRRHDAFATPLLGRLNQPQPSGWSPVYVARVRRAKGSAPAAGLRAAAQAAQSPASTPADEASSGGAAAQVRPAASHAARAPHAGALPQASMSGPGASLPAARPQAAQGSTQAQGRPAAHPQAGALAAQAVAGGIARGDGPAPAAARRHGAMPRQHGIARAVSQLTRAGGAVASAADVDPAGPWAAAVRHPGASAGLQRTAAGGAAAARPARPAAAPATGLRLPATPAAGALPPVAARVPDDAGGPVAAGGPDSPRAQASRPHASSAPHAGRAPAAARPQGPRPADRTTSTPPAAHGTPAVPTLQRRAAGLPLVQQATVPPTIGAARKPPAAPATAGHGAGDRPSAEARLPLPAAGAAGSLDRAASPRPGPGSPSSGAPSSGSPAGTRAGLSGTTPAGDTPAASAATPATPRAVRHDASVPARAPLVRGIGDAARAAARPAIAASTVGGATLQRQAAPAIATPARLPSPQGGQPQSPSQSQGAGLPRHAVDGRATLPSPLTYFAPAASGPRTGPAHVSHVSHVSHDTRDAAAPQAATLPGFSFPARSASLPGRLPRAPAQAGSPASASGTPQRAGPGLDFAARAHARTHPAGEPAPAAGAVAGPVLQRASSASSLPLVRPAAATAAALPDAPLPDAPLSAAAASLQRSAIAPPSFEPPPALSAAVMRLEEAGADARAAAQPAPPPDLDELVERACTRVIAALALEQERRGVSRWL